MTKKECFTLSKMFSEAATQEAGRRNMTKECAAIKSGMLLKYADEPGWVIASND